MKYSKNFEFSLFCITALTTLGATLIAPSLPNIQAHFSSTPHITFLSRLILTLPALFVMISSPIAGFLLTKYKRIKILLCSILLWSVFGISGYFLSSIEWILVFRALFGVASGFVMTCVSVLISEYYLGEKNRDRALVKQNFFSAFGGAIFLILGGVLSDMDWRIPFLVYSLGFVVLFLSSRNLFEPKALQISQSSDFRFLKFIGVYAMTFTSMSLLYFIPTQLPYYLNSHFGVGGSVVGASIASVSIFSAFFSFLYPKLSSKFSIKTIYGFSFSALGLGFFLLEIQNSLLLLLVFLAFGFTWGISFVNHYSWLFSLASPQEKAKAVGFLSSFLFLAQFLSAFWIEPLISYFGLSIALFILGGFSLSIAGLFFILSFRNKSADTLP